MTRHAPAYGPADDPTPAPAKQGDIQGFAVTYAVMVVVFAAATISTTLIWGLLLGLVVAGVSFLSLMGLSGAALFLGLRRQDRADAYAQHHGGARAGIQELTGVSHMPSRELRKWDAA